MQIIDVPIQDLKFAEYNPRRLTKDQYKHLKESLERFGFAEPIVVNKHKDRENVIIGGHQRVRVAKDLEYKEIPVVYLDLLLEQEKELNLRLNKNLGEWDWDLLSGFDEDLLKDVGFMEYELGIGEDFTPAGIEDQGKLDEKSKVKCPECGCEFTS